MIRLSAVNSRCGPGKGRRPKLENKDLPQPGIALPAQTRPFQYTTAVSIEPAIIAPPVTSPWIDR
ncbi:hypothetical protein BOSEA31B_13778 [Hyphomicrobiales bacterium]|nr:hypothetical protein BOSEA31B_13778 [Hyphomicrobiales bacterium]CAH1699547.1 hypothetical protein BOSEA1005_12600 [Hyphomicrobiales bacterium]CAI0343336.1 hypothetical protein BO1005MUT1_220135 [Hyphomicrobiales bacterium]